MRLGRLAAALVAYCLSLAACVVALAMMLGIVADELRERASYDPGWQRLWYVGACYAAAKVLQELGRRWSDEETEGRPQ